MTFKLPGLLIFNPVKVPAKDKRFISNPKGNCDQKAISLFLRIFRLKLMPQVVFSPDLNRKVLKGIANSALQPNSPTFVLTSQEASQFKLNPPITPPCCRLLLKFP